MVVLRSKQRDEPSEAWEDFIYLFIVYLLLYPVTV